MIDPRKPDYGNTPVSPQRPRFAYAPRPVAGAKDESGMQVVVTAAARLGSGGAGGAGGSAQNGHGKARPGAAVLTQDVGAPALSDPRAAVKPLVTITTAFFNTGEVFRETARCVFGQSLQAWEWIIVNDGSTNPEALALLDEFRDIDPRVRVVDHVANRGLSAARNTGFTEARTPYVYQLDSDDLIEPTALEKCLWYMHTHPEAGFVTSYVVGFQAQEYMWVKGFHDREKFLQENLATPMGITRRDVFEQVGGYEEENRGGMEDWDFWLRCAAAGHWGETIPEFLSWYRRREQHWDTWANMKAEERRQDFHRRMLARYAPALDGNFPHVESRPQIPFEDIRVEPGVANPLAKGRRRLLLIAPWLTLGGADKFNVAMVRELVAQGWEVTVATTLPGDNSWLPEFTRLTPDVFVAPHFLRQADIPAFLRYLIESRSPDAVMVSNSEMGYHVLPYLRAYCPEPAYIDLSHMEEPWWKNGGHPRYGAGAQALLDLNIVVSEHLKRWQVERGVDASRVEVCYVSACEDSRFWKRDGEARARVRLELEIPAEQPVILYAGRMVEQKRPRVFARVMEELAATKLDFTCLVAGDGPDLPWLRRFVTERGLVQRVRLLGAVPHATMHEFMSASDVFFLPSMWEGVAISIYEAMSMELAVVGADVGGQRELVIDDCGVLVPRRTEDEEVADYLAALTALVSDSGLRDRMGASGRERIQQHFEPRHMGERIAELVEVAERWRDESPRLPIDRAFAIECATRGLEYLRAWDASEHNHHERMRLWNERHELVRQRDDALREREHLNTELMLARYAIEAGRGPDPHLVAQRMIQSNFRYRAADRINRALKSLGVQGPIKAMAMKVMKGKK